MGEYQKFRTATSWWVLETGNPSTRLIAYQASTEDEADAWIARQRSPDQILPQPDKPPPGGRDGA